MPAAFQAITDPTILLTLLGFLFFIFISGFVFWLCERKKVERLQGLRRGLGGGCGCRMRRQRPLAMAM